MNLLQRARRLCLSPATEWSIPALGMVVLLGSLYALYLLYLGLPRLMKCPPKKTAGYLGSVIVCATVLGLVGSLVIGRMWSV